MLGELRKEDIERKEGKYLCDGEWGALITRHYVEHVTVESTLISFFFK